jgi:hypothetical protein
MHLAPWSDSSVLADDCDSSFGATTAGGSANGNSYEFTGRENDGIMVRYSADGWGFRPPGSMNSNAPG